MNAAQLIRRLKELPPDTEVVLFTHKGPEGYNSVNFLMGTHERHPDATGDDWWLKKNRAKWVKGETRPDYLHRQGKRSKAKRIPFVVLS